MRSILFILFIFLTLNLSASTSFGGFIDKQIEMVKLINDDNATQETIMDVAKKQEELYSKILDNLLANKESFLEKKHSHASEIFALQKIINLNSRRGNKYAVLRDEVLIKSYKIIDYQNTMLKEMLHLLDKYEYSELQVKLGDLFTKNQIEVHSLDKDEYRKILTFEDNSKVIKQAKENIRNFYALLEVNSDILKYISIFDKKIYTLNKYSQFSLIKPILIINSLPVIQIINSILTPYGFNVVKLLIIIFLILIVYFIRKVFYNILESYIVKIRSLEKYSKDILSSIRRLVEISIVLINIELVIYVYNDFVSIDSISKTFNMIYGFLFTFIVFKVANSLATIKIEEIHVDTASIKYEVINVGIKIINVTIWIMGALLILFLAGVNLTAVLSGLGIGGFAIALAAKDSLANFFGTLSILLSDMFSQGDWIEVDTKEGTVVEIGLRVTTLRTFDNALISIPNSVVANKDVKNWNRRSLGRRIKMSIGVKYDSKPDDIKNAVNEIYAMLDQHPGIATVNTKFKYNDTRNKARVIHSKDDEKGVKKTLLVYLDSFGDSSINILIYCFSKTVKWSEWLEVKQDVMFKMMEILNKNNLEFAFPSLSVYHENESELKA